MQIAFKTDWPTHLIDAILPQKYFMVVRWVFNQSTNGISVDMWVYDTSQGKKKKKQRYLYAGLIAFQTIGVLLAEGRGAYNKFWKEKLLGQSDICCVGKHSLGKCDCTAIWDLVNRINPKHLFAVINNNDGPAVVFNYTGQRTA